ncbi:MAG: hypothetical protein LBO09_04880 [Candidatus Peribacteria bacterium]|jgi:hypothetical protein|nr:hypothetical protein [Candidatus Peribacteria bacterium]
MSKKPTKTKRLSKIYCIRARSFIKRLAIWFLIYFGMLWIPASHIKTAVFLIAFILVEMERVTAIFHLPHQKKKEKKVRKQPNPPKFLLKVKKLIRKVRIFFLQTKLGKKFWIWFGKLEKRLDKVIEKSRYLTRVRKKFQHKTVKAVIRFLVLVMFLIPFPGTTDIALATLWGVVLFWVAIEMLIEWLLTALEMGVELLVKIIKRRRH